jgi:hypothetical protein
MLEPAAFKPVRAEKTIDEGTEKRDEENRPKPGEGRGRPLLEKQQMRDGRPSCEITEEQKDFHEAE